MKLIDILVQELPKRGGWPEGVDDIRQDEQGYLHYGNNFFGKLQKTNTCLDVACDRVYTYVCRKQYEQLLQPVSDELCEISQETIDKMRKTTWNGEGLPPVGVECEMQNDNGQWVNVCIIAQFDGFSFGWNYDCRMVYFSDRSDEFHPLRTEAERAIDEMVQLSGVSTGAAKILYNAGYRK